MSILAMQDRGIRKVLFYDVNFLQEKAGVADIYPGAASRGPDPEVLSKELDEAAGRHLDGDIMLHTFRGV